MKTELTTDGAAIAEWMRSVNGAEMLDFVERMIRNCGERELNAIKWTRKGIKQAQRERAQNLQRAEIAEQKRTAHIRTAEAYDLACRRAFDPT